MNALRRGFLSIGVAILALAGLALGSVAGLAASPTSATSDGHPAKPYVVIENAEHLVFRSSGGLVPMRARVENGSICKWSTLSGRR